jgi:hypothetical protein
MSELTYHQKYYLEHKEQMKQYQRDKYAAKCGHAVGPNRGRQPGAKVGSYKDKWIKQGIEAAMAAKQPKGRVMDFTDDSEESTWQNP